MKLVDRYFMIRGGRRRNRLYKHEDKILSWSGYGLTELLWQRYLNDDSDFDEVYLDQPLEAKFPLPFKRKNMK